MENNPQPMLATKMTGLDLGPGPGSATTAQTSAAPVRSHLHSPRTLKELKSKPWSPNMLLSPTPRTSGSDSSFPSSLTPSPRHMQSRQKFSPDMGRLDPKKETADEVLTTPVITVPKCGDAWHTFRLGKSPLGSIEGIDHPHSSSSDDLFPPKDHDMDGSLVGPREPPKDLPMDSDIGLKSPHDGLLAKRRTFAKMKKTPSMTSENSTYSCDTPTTCESSPIHIGQGTSPAQQPQPNQEGDRLKQPIVNNVVSKSPTTLKAKIQADFGSSFIPTTIPSCPSPVVKKGDPVGLRMVERPDESALKKYPDTNLEEGNFKHPNSQSKPENLKLTAQQGHSSLKEGGEVPLPSCYAQSPLKSPNWIAISQNFGGDMWKTPKILDNTSVFDFLPPPNTQEVEPKLGVLGSETILLETVIYRISLGCHSSPQDSSSLKLQQTSAITPVPGEVAGLTLHQGVPWVILAMERRRPKIFPCQKFHRMRRPGTKMYLCPPLPHRPLRYLIHQQQVTKAPFYLLMQWQLSSRSPCPPQWPFLLWVLANISPLLLSTTYTRETIPTKAIV